MKTRVGFIVAFAISLVILVMIGERKVQPGGELWRIDLGERYPVKLFDAGACPGVRAAPDPGARQRRTT